MKRKWEKSKFERRMEQEFNSPFIETVISLMNENNY